MFQKTALVSSLFAAAVSGQGAGTLTPETHPALPAQKCTASGCTTQNTKIVLDANWRWTHDGKGTNCYTGNKWDSICTDNEQCAQQCVVDGADYSGTYGISTSGNALTLKFVTEHQYGTNIGSRVYLMQDDTKYQMFSLLNQEFTFDVDVSKLPCGLNGALYFSEMSQDGGASEFPTNKAGAKYGTGYCDAQCPQDIKYISGQANVEGWNPSESDPNAGTGNLGTCCAEMDIWEANSISAAYTPHPCSVDGQTACTGTECGAGDDRYNGVCDKDGCDFNSFRMGNESFYGEGKTIDTTKKFTVVTQFITSDGTASGTLSEIRRIYKQGTTVVQNSLSDFDGIDATNAISDGFCEQQKTVFEDENHFAKLGGLARMGESIKNGMVLALSIWVDHAANLLWLDSNYPVDADPSKPGIARGTCATDSGKPDDVESNSPGASVTYSNIKWGDLDTTY